MIVKVLNKYTGKCHCEHIRGVYTEQSECAQYKLREAIETLEIASGYRPRNDTCPHTIYYPISPLTARTKLTKETSRSDLCRITVFY